LERENLFEMRPERWEIVGLLRLFPGLLSSSRGASEFLDECLRYLRRPIVGSAYLANVRGGIRLRIADQFRSLDGAEDITDPWIGQLLRRGCREESHLPAAEYRGVRRHVRLLIHDQDGGTGVQHADFLAAANQFGLGICRVHDLAPCDPGEFGYCRCTE